MVVASPPKEVSTFTTDDGDKDFVLEASIEADFGMVRSWKGDRHGNLVYLESSRNFNALAAMCGRSSNSVMVFSFLTRCSLEALGCRRSWRRAWPGPWGRARRAP